MLNREPYLTLLTQEQMDKDVDEVQRAMSAYFKEGAAPDLARSLRLARRSLQYGVSQKSMLHCANCKTLYALAQLGPKLSRSDGSEHKDSPWTKEILKAIELCGNEGATIEMLNEARLEFGLHPSQRGYKCETPHRCPERHPVVCVMGQPAFYCTDFDELHFGLEERKPKEQSQGGNATELERLTCELPDWADCKDLDEHMQQCEALEGRIEVLLAQACAWFRTEPRSALTLAGKLLAAQRRTVWKRGLRLEPQPTRKLTLAQIRAHKGLPSAECLLSLASMEGPDIQALASVMIERLAKVFK